MADRKVKAPDVVYVLVRKDNGEPTFVDSLWQVAAGCRCDYETINRYRLDTPKPAAKKAKTAIRHELDKEARAKKRGGRG